MAGRLVLLPSGSMSARSHQPLPHAAEHFAGASAPARDAERTLGTKPATALIASENAPTG